MDEKQKQFIRDNYPFKGKMWCCEQLGLTEGQIRSFCYENKIKLDQQSDFFKEFQERAKNSKIGKKRPIQSLIMKQKAKEGLLDNFIKCSEEKKKKISEHNKKWIEKNGHPKGFLGGKHSQKTKDKISITSKKTWSNENHFLNSQEHKQNQSDNMSKSRAKGILSSNYSRAKQGTINIGGKTIFVRSSWEANIVAYYEFLKNKNEIKDWEYEPKTFWFESIKRGVRSYKPDLLITNNDGSNFWIEIKGWMDDKSKTKLKRFAKYYPNEIMCLIDKKRYNEIKKISSFIPNWGILDSDEYLSSIIKCSVDGCENKNHSKELCRKHYYKLYKK